MSILATTMGAMMTIRLTRLPDISNDRQLQATSFAAYGRFALLNDGSFWFGDLRSSHPSTTRIGWYWAVDMNRDLLVSARGAAIDGEILLTSRKDALAWLVDRLVGIRAIGKPDDIRIG